MAKERLKSPRARLFVALDLPEALRAGIVAWGRRELRDPALRAVRPESLHITLAFLGYLPEKEIGRLGEIVEGLRSPAPRSARRSAARSPRAAGPASSRCRSTRRTAIALQAELEERLVAARLYEPEKRPFWPHVTVARVRPEGKGSKRPRRVSRAHRAGCRRTSCSPTRGRPDDVSTVLNSSRRVRNTRPLAQVELSEGRQ